MAIDDAFIILELANDEMLLPMMRQEANKSEIKSCEFFILPLLAKGLSGIIAECIIHYNTEIQIHLLPRICLSQDQNNNIINSYLVNCLEQAVYFFCNYCFKTVFSAIELT